MRAVYSVQLLVRPSCWSWSLVRCLTASCSCITKETNCLCGNPLMTTRWLTALCMWQEIGDSPTTFQEHNYCHWLDNVPPIGPHQAWKVLQHPGMANPQKRDASALRLLSWLSFSLDDRTSALLSRLMKQLASDLLESSSAILQIVHESEIGAPWHNLAETRMGLIDRVTVSNLAQPSAVTNQLYRTFLTRLSFPRLVHFLDLVLPQMVPHQRIREQNQIRHLTSHWLGACLHRNGRALLTSTSTFFSIPMLAWSIC